MCQKAQANLAEVRETGSTWEFHIPRIDTWGYLAICPTGVPGPTAPAIRPMATVLEVVGTARADRGRRFEEHSCCGKEVLVEDVVVRLRREQILVPNRLGRGYPEETAYTINWVTDGQDRCRIGFLPRAYVAQGGLFDGVLCQVVSIGNAFDDNHNERAKVKHACGYARAQVIHSTVKIVIKFSKTKIILYYFNSDNM